jgi:hypothetical protein
VDLVVALAVVLVVALAVVVVLAVVVLAVAVVVLAVVVLLVGLVRQIEGAFLREGGLRRAAFVAADGTGGRGTRARTVFIIIA